MSTVNQYLIHSLKDNLFKQRGYLQVGYVHVVSENVPLN